jgi:sulfate permease, SulP family
MNFDLKKIQYDLIGGTTAGLVVVPRNIAFGILVFMPFGPQYVHLGVLAGLVSAIFGNIASAPFGAISVMCVSTFSLSALLLMEMNTLIVKRLAGIEDAIPIAITFCFLATFIAGCTQSLCGVIKIGSFVKFIPFPVMNGILNGTAIAIIISQIQVVLNLPTDIDLISAVLKMNSEILTLATVGLLTGAVSILGPKLIPAIPSVFFGLALGTLIFYGVSYLSGELVGPRLTAIPAGLTLIHIPADGLSILSGSDFFSIALTAILFGISIGVADVMRAALSSLAIDLKLQQRSDFNRELVSEGLGNMITACFGGITSTGNATAALNNHSNGGTTAWSRVICGSVALIIVFFLNEAIELLPTVILATMLIVLTYGTIDWTFLQSIKELKDPNLSNRREIIIDLMVIALVVALVVFVDLFIALAVGISTSMVLFIERNRRSLVREKFSANQIPSNIVRLQEEQSVVDQFGSSIQVLALEGPLFFGSADQVHDLIDKLLADEVGVDTIILDMKRVTNIDSTAEEILFQCRRKIELASKTLILSSIDEVIASTRFPIITARVGKNPEMFAPSLEDALARAEENLIDSKSGTLRRDKINLGSHDALANMKKGEVDSITQAMKLITFSQGDLILTQGDLDRSLYFIVQGRVNIVLNRDTFTPQRLGTLCAGCVLGEAALFDAGPRSASAVALGQVQCFCLPYAKLDWLRKTNPDLAYSLLNGVSRVLSQRLRNLNMISSHLRL